MLFWILNQPGAGQLQITTQIKPILQYEGQWERNRLLFTVQLFQLINFRIRFSTYDHIWNRYIASYSVLCDLQYLPDFMNYMITLHGTAKHSLHLSLLWTVASLMLAPWYRPPGLEMKKWPGQKAVRLRHKSQSRWSHLVIHSSDTLNSYVISSPVTCVGPQQSPKRKCLYFRTFRRIFSLIIFSSP